MGSGRGRRGGAPASGGAAGGGGRGEVDGGAGFVAM
jgi:hypothetical protein